jgi:hypothetical protein
VTRPSLMTCIFKMFNIFVRRDLQKKVTSEIRRLVQRLFLDLYVKGRHARNQRHRSDSQENKKYAQKNLLNKFM